MKPSKNYGISSPHITRYVVTDKIYLSIIETVSVLLSVEIIFCQGCGCLIFIIARALYLSEFLEDSSITRHSATIERRKGTVQRPRASTAA